MESLLFDCKCLCLKSINAKCEWNKKHDAYIEKIEYVERQIISRPMKFEFQSERYKENQPLYFIRIDTLYTLRCVENQWPSHITLEYGNAEKSQSQYIIQSKSNDALCSAWWLGMQARLASSNEPGANNSRTERQSLYYSR